MVKRNILITLAILFSSIVGIMFMAQPASAVKCEDIKTSIIKVPGCAGKSGTTEVDGKTVIFDIIKLIIKIMTGVIGLVAVGAVIYGAILYSTSGSSPETLKKAKDIWVNVVIGLLLFAFMVAITNFLIPGGVFG